MTSFSEILFLFPMLCLTVCLYSKVPDILYSLRKCCERRAVCLSLTEGDWVKSRYDIDIVNQLANSYYWTIALLSVECLTWWNKFDQTVLDLRYALSWVFFVNLSLLILTCNLPVGFGCLSKKSRSIRFIIRRSMIRSKNAYGGKAASPPYAFIGQTTGKLIT